MAEDRPNLIVFAGPNGAGKSTAAPGLLADLFGPTEFVNADVIAQALSHIPSMRTDLEAGKIMLKRVRELAAQRRDFAFETTLASRTFAPWFRNLRLTGYAVHLVYLWLPTPEIAIARVAHRVQEGGHHVPESTIRRRYGAGLRNFFRIYRPLADRWRFYDNSDAAGPRLVAAGSGTRDEIVDDLPAWQTIHRGIGV